MKKYVRIIISLIFLLIVFRFFFLFIYRGRNVDYVIREGNNTYEVREEYIRNKSGISNHYYLEVQFNEITFNFRISDIFDKKSYIVDKIYSFENEQYICVLPIFIDDSIQTDILCQKDNMIYPYQELQNESLKLDNFAASMKTHGYSVNISEENVTLYGISVIKNNIASSHTIVIPSYNGVFFINEKEKSLVTSMELFENDVYVQPIQGVVSNYYVVADYDSSYSFHKFKVVDINTKKVSTITSNSSISMNSYVQGIVDDSIYLIDRSNRKQYKIDVLNKSISLVGNSKKGVLYYNGAEFENKSIYDALNNDLLFNLSLFDSSKYDYIHMVDGIYYSYLRTNTGYDVYISYEENRSISTYVFSVSSLDKVRYVENYVYFIDDDTLYYYHPKGVVKVLTYTELFYNSKLNFWVYKK